MAPATSTCFGWCPQMKQFCWALRQLGSRCSAQVAHFQMFGRCHQFRLSRCQSMLGLEKSANANCRRAGDTPLYYYDGKEVSLHHGELSEIAFPLTPALSPG